MTTTKTSIKLLKPGKYCVIDGEPCRVLTVTSSKSGKHGGAKTRLDAIGIFDEKKRSIVYPSDTDIEVPIVDKKTGQVVAIMGENVQIMDLESFETFEAPITEELKDKITQGCEVTYWVILERKMLVGIK